MSREGQGQVIGLDARPVIFHSDQTLATFGDSNVDPPCICIDCVFNEFLDR